VSRAFFMLFRNWLGVLPSPIASKKLSYAAFQVVTSSVAGGEAALSPSWTPHLESQ
jgi:hypothetical protein